MLKKFEITYTNLNKRCSLHRGVKKEFFASSDKEARSFCKDLCDDGNRNFEILNSKEIKRG